MTSTVSSSRTSANHLSAFSIVDRWIFLKGLSFFSIVGGWGFLLSLFFVFPSACTPPTNQESVQDASPQEKEPEKPANCTAAPSKPCLAGCGNSLGIGMPCTKGGGECNDNKKAILCTIDFSQTDLHFCTFPCVVDEDCGEGAICQGDPEKPKSGRGCFPLTCGGRAEPNAEAAPTEATTDAGEMSTTD